MTTDTTSKKQKKQQTGLKISEIEALTQSQRLFFKEFNNYQVLSMTGYAGTGKSFIALGRGLKEVEKGLYNEVLIIRSAVPGRDIGFMPGNKKEKMEVYEGPYIRICSKLYGRGDAYSVLKQKGIIHFESSSFLRGETFENSVVIIDEAQNMSYQELYTILTRVGENCKVIICGDTLQDDLTSERFKEVSGYAKILSVLRSIPSCYSIRFSADEIVRSGFVRELILATQE